MNIPSPRILQALVDLTQLSEDEVRAGVFAVGPGGYQTWTIPKGNGRRRRIHAPVAELKLLQEAILHAVLYRAPISPCAHGFVPGRSIVTNARVHAPHAKALLSVDLEDAYPSVSTRRVRSSLEWAVGRYVKDLFPGMALADRRSVFDVLAEICTVGGALPQGAPTSGMILNFACARVDRLAMQLVREYRPHLPGLRYSRYADDLTFSAAVEFPQDAEDRVATAVLRSGFRVNRRKVERYGQRHRDLVVCGIRIRNGHLTLSRERLRKYRALFHQALRFPPDAVPSDVRDRITGTLGFLTMVTPACPRLLEGPLRRLVGHHGAWLCARQPPSAPTGAFLPYGF